MMDHAGMAIVSLPLLIATVDVVGVTAVGSTNELAAVFPAELVNVMTSAVLPNARALLALLNPDNAMSSVVAASEYAAVFTTKVLAPCMEAVAIVTLVLSSFELSKMVPAASLNMTCMK